MRIYNPNVQIFNESSRRIDFLEAENGLEFSIDLNLLATETPFEVGDLLIEDQLLFSRHTEKDLIIVYVHSGKVLVNFVEPASKKPFRNTDTSYKLSFENSSDLISFKQTGETSFTLLDNSGKHVVSIHDIVAQDATEYVFPIDLGLTTVEYRYLLIGKVFYKKYNTFFIYDLFRKELFTKNLRFIIESNNAGLEYKLINPNMLEITFDTERKNVAFHKITGKGKKISDIYELEAFRNQHLLSIFTINDVIYYVHNKSQGIYITRGNPVKVTGYKPNMRIRFIGRHLYIFGRFTHYAYKANGQYEYLYAEGVEKPIAKFYRPFTIKLLKRYGFFKIPISLLTIRTSPPINLYIGSEKEIMHNLKIKNGRQKLRVVAFRKEKNEVVFLSSTTSGNISLEKTNDLEKFSLKNRMVGKMQTLKNNKITLYLFRLVFRAIGKLPRKQKLVIFESFHAKQYSDNPRAIYEYMKKHYNDYQLVWSINKDAEKLFNDFNIPYIRRFTFRWFLTFPRAKYWVNNVRLPSWMPKPHNTVYLQTWHGTPLKKLGIDIGEIHMPGTKTSTYKKNFVTESAKWDYLVSPNAYSTEIFRRAFHYSGKVIESGYPRNDILTNPSEELIANLKEKLGIPAEKKIMLYAPTWRDNEFYQKGKYKFEFQFDLENWKKEFGDEWVLLSRMHYLVAENFDFSAHEGTVYDVSSYPDIRDLYLISDLMITDYSSVFFDYAILNRPIIFFMYDLEQYRDELRGFYIDMEKEAPGPIVQTEEALFQAMHEGGNASVESNSVFQAFREKFSALEDGRATERVVQVFLNHKSE